MTIEVPVYRARIGLFAASCKPTRPRSGSSGKEKNRRGKFVFSLALCLHAVICVAILTGFAATSCYERSMIAAAAVSGVGGAMLSESACMMTSTLHALPSGITSVAYTFDRSQLLLLGGDIEEDPGPLEMEDLENFGKVWMAQLMEQFQGVVNEGNKKLHYELSILNAKVSKIENDLSSLKERIGEQEEAIDSLERAQFEAAAALNEVEEKVEQQDQRSRRDNVLLYGIPEPDADSHGNPEDCVGTVASTVNKVLENPLQACDIARAHRVGKHREGKTRPVIAQLIHSADKVAILRKRQDLKAKDIGVSSDLTETQRENIRRAREEGYFAYYRGGVLHTEERRAGSVPADRRQTRSATRGRGGGRSDRR